MADQSITDYTAATALDRADLIEVVQDVATTPVNRKATLDVLDPGQVLGAAAPGDATSVAVGPGADAQLGPRQVCIGQDARTGNASFTSRNEHTAVGYDAQVTGSGIGGTAIGARSRSTGTQSQAFGADANASAAASIAVGGNASCSGNRALAVGDFASTTADDAVSLGPGTSAGHSDSVAIGHDSSTTATFQVMVGPRDVEITGTDKGLVLEDRTLETRHRVYLDNGVLEIEAA